jgi:phosphate transport system protein
MEMGMTVRVTFDEQLRALQDDLLAMGETVTAALAEAVRALVTHDAALAEAIVAADAAVNAQQADIDHAAFRLLATQQPVARDLRLIMSVSAIAVDIERIGDYAKGIANIALRSIDAAVPTLTVPLTAMTDLVRLLLSDMLCALVDADAAAARAVAARDAELDRMYRQIHHELLELMMADPARIPDLDRLMWISRSLERAGDHVTNIGERVVFQCTGEVVELNAEGTSLR